LRRGDIWLMELPTEKPRPVVIVLRDSAIPVLNSIVVAPVTSTLRSTPTCLPVGPSEGLDRDSVAMFDELRSVPPYALSHKIGALDDIGRVRMCNALRSMANC